MVNSHFSLRVSYGVDIPSGPVVKSLSCNAEGTNSIPGEGTEIPHAAEQLSAHASTRVHAMQGKILHDVTKTQLSQIHKFLPKESVMASSPQESIP